MTNHACETVGDNVAKEGSGDIGVPRLKVPESGRRRRQQRRDIAIPVAAFNVSREHTDLHLKKPEDKGTFRGGPKEGV